MKPLSSSFKTLVKLYAIWAVSNIGYWVLSYDQLTVTNMILYAVMSSVTVAALFEISFASFDTTFIEREPSDEDE